MARPRKSYGAHGWHVHELPHKMRKGSCSCYMQPLLCLTCLIVWQNLLMLTDPEKDYVPSQV